jgi:hypothetical protein
MCFVSLRCTKAECGPVVPTESAELAVCSLCGVVYRSNGQLSVVDPAATRQALFRAAAACAGPNWSLQALALDRYLLSTPSTACLARLGLAETGVASLASLRD